MDVDIMGLGDGNSDAIMVMVELGWRDCRSVAVVRARTPAPTMRTSGGVVVVDILFVPELVGYNGLDDIDGVNMNRSCRVS